MVDDYLIKWTNTSGIETNILNAIDIRVTTNKDAKSNSCEIILPYRNYTIDGDIIFQNGEGLVVYMKKDGLIDSLTPSNDDLMFTATIIETERQMEAGTIKLLCGDLSYSLLSGLFSQDVVDTPNEIVNTIVQNASMNGIKQITTSATIQSARSNGSSFDSVNFVSAWKTGYDAIAELSRTDYTGDTQSYIFWFEPDGSFNWIFPPSTTEAFEISFNDGISNLKHTKEDAETVSMVIYNAGPDLNGTDTYGFKYNEFAESIKGSVRYYPMLDISKSLKRINFSPSDNNAFIAEQKRIADAHSTYIISKYSGGVNKTTCDIKGRKVNIAKLHKVSSPMFPQQELRLERVVHTFNKNGWSTRLELEEDIREN